MDYLVDHLIPLPKKISDTRFPLFFILDVHSSHMTWRFLSHCLNHNVRVLCLPPHSTHLLQPLDVGVFSALQKAYSKEVDSYVRNVPDVIRKGNFWPLLKAARSRAMTKKNILEG